MGVQERNGSFAVYVYRPDYGKKVYVGTRKTELEARALFRDKSEEFAGLTNAGSIANGAAAEHFAIGQLLIRGHQVAKPVVDIEGVDLIVDYAVKVQIKSSGTMGSRGTGRKHGGYPSFHCARKRAGKPNRAYDVDVFLFFDRANFEFFVVPVGEVPPGGTLQLTPKYSAYREAWHWFREFAA